MIRVVALCTAVTAACLFATGYGYATNNRVLILASVLISAPTLLALTLCVAATRSRKETQS